MKSNTVGSLVLWHDGLWLAQLSRKEGHSFGKWRAPGSKMAWKSGCFSYSQENEAVADREALHCAWLLLLFCFRLPLIHINSLLWHRHMILHSPECLLDTVRVYILAANEWKYRKQADLNFKSNKFCVTFSCWKMGVLGKYSSVLYISLCLQINGLEAKIAAWDINRRGLKRRVRCHISPALSIS